MIDACLKIKIRDNLDRLTEILKLYQKLKLHNVFYNISYKIYTIDVIEYVLYV